MGKESAHSSTILSTWPKFFVAHRYILHPAYKVSSSIIPIDSKVKLSFNGNSMVT